MLFAEVMYHCTKIKLCQLSRHLMCVLCGGYFIDATTIVECLHSFCRSCIVRYLESSKFCPICDVQVHKTRPLLHIRSDKSLQDLVYKLVPGLFHEEMRRRRDFFSQHPYIDTSGMDLEQRGQSQMVPLHTIVTEKISLIMNCSSNQIMSTEYALSANHSSFKAVDMRRCLLCPPDVTVGHLKKLLHLKYCLRPEQQIDIFCQRHDEPIADNYTLLDISFFSSWSREQPMTLSYCCYDVGDRVEDGHTTSSFRKSSGLPSHLTVGHTYRGDGKANLSCLMNKRPASCTVDHQVAVKRLRLNGQKGSRKKLPFPRALCSIRKTKKSDRTTLAVPYRSVKNGMHVAYNLPGSDGDSAVTSGSNVATCCAERTFAGSGGDGGVGAVRASRTCSMSATLFDNYTLPGCTFGSEPASCFTQNDVPTVSRGRHQWAFTPSDLSAVAVTCCMSRSPDSRWTSGQASPLSDPRLCGVAARCKRKVASVAPTLINRDPATGKGAIPLCLNVISPTDAGVDVPSTITIKENQQLPANGQPNLFQELSSNGDSTSSRGDRSSDAKLMHVNQLTVTSPAASVGCHVGVDFSLVEGENLSFVSSLPTPGESTANMAREGDGNWVVTMDRMVPGDLGLNVITKPALSCVGYATARAVSVETDGVADI